MMISKISKPRSRIVVALAVVIGFGLPSSAMAQEETRHPTVVDPGSDASPPSDALVLFHGTDLSLWESGSGGPAKWQVEDGKAVVNGTGNILTRQEFGDVQLHIEWATPKEEEDSGQSRGNSGVYLQGRYEVQVLDSYQNQTYSDGQAGALYGHFPPLVNACRKPGEWQSYDIIFRAPTVSDESEITEPGTLTVWHNGVLVQDHVPVTATTRAATFGEPAVDGTGPLMLQDHGSPVQFRNIWLRELDSDRSSKPLKIHVISGSNEYESESSLKQYQRYLEEQFDVSITASWVEDGAEDLPGVEKIRDADLLLVFTRRMKLPKDQMELIEDHWQQGKPIVGIRTASHAFRRETNRIFDHEVLGGNYQGHYGDEPVTVRNVAPDHPVLRGIGEFTSRKLYKAGKLAEEAILLQTGHIEGDRSDPVTWAHRYNGGRMVYTSLGVPEDFKNDNFVRMLTNAIFWAAHRNRQALTKQD